MEPEPLPGPDPIEVFHHSFERYRQFERERIFPDSVQYDDFRMAVEGLFRAMRIPTETYDHGHIEFDRPIMVREVFELLIEKRILPDYFKWDYEQIQKLKGNDGENLIGLPTQKRLELIDKYKFMIDYMNRLSAELDHHGYQYF